MRQLLDLMVSFHIETKVESIKIRYSELVPFAKCDELSIVKIESSYGKGDRSTGLVYKICRTTETFGEFVVGNYTKIVRFIEVGWKIITSINSFFTKIAIPISRKIVHRYIPTIRLIYPRVFAPKIPNHRLFHHPEGRRSQWFHLVVI